MAKDDLTEAQQAERAEIRGKAKAAAQAAGKDWKQLSPDERKTFRRQVRKDAKKSG
jgi:acyl-CoA reductase-like NAD-dependent aldehyde dehydrogenase